MNGCCFCEELTHANDNQYYNELGKTLGVHSRILMETDNWCVIPTLGCFTAGYTLLVCKQHYQSLANLSEELFNEMLELKNAVEEKLFQKLGLFCIAFEHGTTDPCYAGANSVEHVHFHIVPYSQCIWHEIAMKNELDGFDDIADYESLFLTWRNNPPKTYLLFQDINKSIHYKPDAGGMPSQLFRKCLAPYFNVSQWDWRQEYYQANFIKTIDIF